MQKKLLFKQFSLAQIKFEYQNCSFSSNSFLYKGAVYHSRVGRSASDGNEVVVHIPQRSSIAGISPSDCLVVYPEHSLQGSYSSAKMQSVDSMTPTDWAFELLGHMSNSKTASTSGKGSDPFQIGLIPSLFYEDGTTNESRLIQDCLKNIWSPRYFSLEASLVPGDHLISDKQVGRHSGIRWST